MRNLLWLEPEGIWTEFGNEIQSFYRDSIYGCIYNKTLYFDDNGQKSVDVLSVRPQKNLAIIKLKGIDTIAQAEEIKGKILYCNRDDATIDEEVNYIADLIGCRVVDIDNGKEYGKVVDVLNYGSCDIYDTVSSGKHILIPATPDIVKEINTQYQIIKIKAMKGLFDEN